MERKNITIHEDQSKWIETTAINPSTLVQEAIGLGGGQAGGDAEVRGIVKSRYPSGFRSATG